MTKFLALCLSVLKALNWLIDEWKAHKARQEGRNQVKAKIEKEHAKAKERTDKVRTDVSAADDSSLDARLSKYYRD